MKFWDSFKVVLIKKRKPKKTFRGLIIFTIRKV